MMKQVLLLIFQGL